MRSKSVRHGRLADEHAGLSYFGEFIAVQFGLINALILIFAILATYRWLCAANSKSSQTVAFLILLADRLSFT